jgi:hypothetical protein
MSNNDLEKPVPDVMEQERSVAEDEPEQAGRPASLPFDANEADAVEQSQEISLDEDDYR